MTTYKYKGLSPDGAKLSGVIKAYNEFEAVAQLRETCSVITKIEEVKETQSWNKQIGTKKIKDKELAIICSQFAIILTSGLPIVRCVEMVAAQARTKELQKMLKKVAEDVSGGKFSASISGMVSAKIRIAAETAPCWRNRLILVRAPHGNVRAKSSSPMHSISWKRSPARHFA